MEYNKLGVNNRVFLFGIICLVISLGLLFFSLYLLPYMLWELRYNIPDFILDWLASLQDEYGYSSAGSKAVVWFSFFIPCVITGIISYYISHYIDKQVYGIEDQQPEEEQKPEGQMQKEIKESASLGLKILSLMIAIVVAIFLLQYVIQS